MIIGGVAVGGAQAGAVSVFSTSAAGLSAGPGAFDGAVNGAEASALYPSESLFPFEFLYPGGVVKSGSVLALSDSAFGAINIPISAIVGAVV